MHALEAEEASEAEGKKVKSLRSQLVTAKEKARAVCARPALHNQDTLHTKHCIIRTICTQSTP